jgi:hypothetical protein|tara:strand:+ start:372 stop:542 length:171 start_codon:yes stop_codon:yes gene_type:complete
MSLNNRGIQAIRLVLLGKDWKRLVVALIAHNWYNGLYRRWIEVSKSITGEWTYRFY